MIRIPSTNGEEKEEEGGEGINRRGVGGDNGFLRNGAFVNRGNAAAALIAREESLFDPIDRILSAISTEWRGRGIGEFARR